LKTLWPGVATAVEASPLLNIANSIRGSGTALVQAKETFNDDTRSGDPV
jgi:hypothetical protein